MESFIPRIGGKRLLRKDILARFPTEILRYIEPFGGAGWLLFSRERHAPEEIFNDTDGELINLFRCVKHHCAELQRQMAWLLNSRELFEDALALKTSRGLTDIQRAALYFLVCKGSYGADGRTYGASAKDLERTVRYFEKISHRLRMVKIERRSFDQVILQYDKPGALIYADPPYHGTEDYYNGPFGDTEHQRLRQLLGRIQGRFLLSYNDDPYIRELYSGFTIEELSRQHSLKARYNDGGHPYRELLIRNY